MRFGANIYMLSQLCGLGQEYRTSVLQAPDRSGTHTIQHTLQGSTQNSMCSLVRSYRHPPVLSPISEVSPRGQALVRIHSILFLTPILVPGRKLYTAL